MSKDLLEMDNNLYNQEAVIEPADVASQSINLVDFAARDTVRDHVESSGSRANGVSASSGKKGEMERGVELIRRMIDLAEAKKQVLFSLPLIITNAALYFIPLVSVMFTGHIGEHELTAANLANSWASVTGLSLMVISHPPLPLPLNVNVLCSFSYIITPSLRLFPFSILKARIWLHLICSTMSNLNDLLTTDLLNHDVLKKLV